MTIMTTGFIPCGAKLPIIGLFAGAIFGNSAWVSVSAFFIGIAAVVVTGIILKKTKLFAGEPAPFVMELPAYHAPSILNALRSMWERGWAFIKRAGTVILISSIILWFLMGYGFENGALVAVEDANHSLLAVVGSAVAWIFYPLGWVGENAWKLTCATITGLIAKEEVVNFFGVAFQYAGEADLMDDASGLYPAIAAAFTGLNAYSFMIFNLLCAPCFAAMGAIKREMNNWKWTLGHRRGQLRRLDRGGLRRPGGADLAHGAEGLSARRIHPAPDLRGRRGRQVNLSGERSDFDAPDFDEPDRPGRAGPGGGPGHPLHLEEP